MKNLILNNFILISLAFSCLVLETKGHGRLLEPVARGSRWRFNISAPTDYDDNQGFCGGFFQQWQVYNGKCGLCGNDYQDKIPRPHELGGIYGEGVIVKNYKQGTNINVGVLITANHKGYFTYDLCNLDNDFESETCFNKNLLKLTSNEYKFMVDRNETGWFNATVKIPHNFTCNHCVLRWTYITGNSWGVCEDGTEALGCGPQENFKGCSDIAISN